MEFTGKIIAVLTPREGQTARGSWKSQQYVIESEGEHPHRMLFDVFGADKIQQLNIQQGETLTVSFDPRAEQKDGRWYGNNRAWNVTHQMQATPANPLNAQQA